MLEHNDDLFLAVYISQVGWNLWNLFIACFPLGLTVFLYNGCPFYPEVGFWEMMDKFKVAYTFLATSVVDKMEKNDVVPGIKPVQIALCIFRDLMNILNVINCIQLL